MAEEQESADAPAENADARARMASVSIIIHENTWIVFISGLLVFVGVVAYWWLASPCHYGESRSPCQQDACSGLAMPCLSDTSRDHSPNLLNVCSGLGKMISGFSSLVILILAGEVGQRVAWKGWRYAARVAFGLAWRIGFLWILLTSIGEYVGVESRTPGEFSNSVFGVATPLFLRNTLLFGGAFMLVHAVPEEWKEWNKKDPDPPSNENQPTRRLKLLELALVFFGALGSFLGGMAALYGLYAR